jgi:secreted trypsin-like serine protease
MPGGDAQDLPVPIEVPTPASTDAPMDTKASIQNIAPEPEVTPEPTPTETTEVPAEEVTDLASINAALCGLPVQPVDDSLTIAELTGAQPLDDDIVGVSTINGAAAALSDFPGLVKMEPREILPGGAIASGHCGATRIAEHWFITAAHCLDDDYDEVLLIAGAETLSSPFAKRVQATGSVCHAAYGGAGNNYVNDIALVRIADDALVDLADIPIARFGATSETLVPMNYQTAHMAGWGLTSFRGQLSPSLLSATLTMSGVGPAAISVESLNGSGPCVGDSGGPLFVDDADGPPIVVGVLSVVEQNLETRQFCEGEYSARYTNLQGFKPWIDAVMSACDAGNGLCGF